MIRPPFSIIFKEDSPQISQIRIDLRGRSKDLIFFSKFLYILYSYERWSTKLIDSSSAPQIDQTAILKRLIPSQLIFIILRVEFISILFFNPIFFNTKISIIFF